ncbi:proline-rich transmembrane protein 4 isoform X2 [Talpa occidentalis]|uniref:proline-rich transmembrane protein 4 isoform X2 n=1 Tax=Talpa occidentalis TaxID=50954 RepID=UPI0023FA3489|nr:proline-rich transmembrane protein 4 isoform X2 [Talpa occidentalis]
MAGHGCLGLFCWVLLAVPVGPQLASSVPGAPLTTLTPPPQSETSMLSLNLGLNFKLHLRGPAAAWGNPVTETQVSPGSSQEPEEEVASGLRTDPLWERLVGSFGNSPPEWGSAEGSSTPWASSLPLQSTAPLSAPTDQPTAPNQQGMSTVTWDTALMATAPPSSAPRPPQSELELKFDVALRAGAAPTLGHRTLPLLPSLRASLAEIAGRLGPFGFFGTTLSPLRNFSGLSPSGPTTSLAPSSASGISDAPGFFDTTLSQSPAPLERKLPSPSPPDPSASLSPVSPVTAPQAMTPWTSAPPPQSTCGAASRKPFAARLCCPAFSRVLPLGKPCLASVSTAQPRWGPRRPARVGGPRRCLVPPHSLSFPLPRPGPRAAALPLARCADSPGTARPCCCVPAQTGLRAVPWSVSSAPLGPQEAALASRPLDPTRPCPHPLTTPQSLFLSCRPKRPCCRSNSWTPADR